MQMIKERIESIRGPLLTVIANGARIGDLVQVERRDGTSSLGIVIQFDRERVTIQLFENTRGLSVHDKVIFLQRHFTMQVSENSLGSVYSGSGKVREGIEPSGDSVQIGMPSFNPIQRRLASCQLRTNIPMIDVFNPLVQSQKIPLFSAPGSNHNALLMRIANQTDADIVIIGGIGLRYTEYQKFLQNAYQNGSIHRTLFFIHLATDPIIEAVIVPDLAIAAAESFALKGKNVLVLLTDMTSFADALKEIAITLDQIPSSRGYPGDLYTQLANRYEKAVAIEGAGSVTILAATTMPGDDVTHPVPDLTGYITEGQYYLKGNAIEPFGSLSRLKQLVVGKATRKDHPYLANTMIQLYADSLRAEERDKMGFRISAWDQKLLHFGTAFRKEMMSLNANIALEDALDLGWKMLSTFFDKDEVGIRSDILMHFWPKH